MAKRCLHSARLSAAAMVCGLVAGCTGPLMEQGASSNPAAGCVDDSKQCVDKRQAALKIMMADGKRAWVTAPETPASYATGVKLFAYRQKKGELTCAELAHGREETRSAPAALKPGSVPGANDSRLAQVRDMSQQVHKELSREFERVCKSPTEAKAGFAARAPKG